MRGLSVSLLNWGQEKESRNRTEGATKLKLLLGKTRTFTWTGGRYKPTGEFLPTAVSAARKTCLDSLAVATLQNLVIQEMSSKTEAGPHTHSHEAAVSSHFVGCPSARLGQPATIPQPRGLPSPPSSPHCSRFSPTLDLARLRKEQTKSPQ